jgi:hypothetical protein
MSADLMEKHFAIAFPIFFGTMWVIVGTVLALLSGWFRLAGAFPDQSIEPILKLRGQSGTMGAAIGMRGVLTLSVCPTGLRVGMMRIFCPFCRDFFVPWESITVVRSTTLIWPAAKLQFGDPVVGSLRLAGHTADRIARAAGRCWPEVGPFPEEKPAGIFRRLLAQWAMTTAFAALFFILVPLAVAPSGSRPTIPMAILFPAIVFGLVFVVRYFVEKADEP